VEKIEILEKLKQLKYQHLKKMFTKHLSKTPSNCKYNKVIILPNKTQLNICTFNLEENIDVDLCYKAEHSKDCNAFCSLYTKEQLKEILLEEIKDPQKRATYYKDVNILYWLYPDLEKEEFPVEKKNLWEKIILFFKKLKNRYFF